jgi:hypothetical protein
MEPKLGRNVKLQITRTSGFTRNTSGHRLGGLGADGQTVTRKAKKNSFLAGSVMSKTHASLK